jgi:hypothetical protein
LKEVSFVVRRLGGRIAVRNSDFALSFS